MQNTPTIKLNLEILQVTVFHVSCSRDIDLRLAGFLCRLVDVAIGHKRGLEPHQNRWFLEIRVEHATLFHDLVIIVVLDESLY